jgi:rare lipoprotein A
MADGHLFHARALTAASRRVPLGRKLRVCNLRNDRCVRVTVTDRGPYVKGRIIDLSLGAARAIGAEHAGVVPVRIEPR